MGKKLAIEHHLIRPNEVIKLLEMMGGKNTDNADGCSFLYYTICTPKINNPNNVIKKFLVPDFLVQGAFSFALFFLIIPSPVHLFVLFIPL